MASTMGSGQQASPQLTGIPSSLDLGRPSLEIKEIGPWMLHPRRKLQAKVGVEELLKASAAGLPQGQQPGESEEASARDERRGLLIPSSQKGHLIASAGLCSLKVSHTTQPLLGETDYTRA